MPAPLARRRMIGLALLVATLPACDPISNEALVVATGWPAADRNRIADEFRAWLTSSGRDPIRIDWLILDPGDDLVGLSERRHPPDVLLGGAARDFDRLARSGRLSALPIAGSPPWAVARERFIRAPDVREGLAFDDPRRDSIALAWAESQLAGDRFTEGYARLVRAAGIERRIGRRAGSAASALARGEIDGAVMLDTEGPDGIRWPEGVAIVAGSRHPDRAKAFAEFLAPTGRVRPSTSNQGRTSDRTLELLADLLGSTLVDAQDELQTAWQVMVQRASPPGPLRALTEPPPWPPASIAKILDREGEPAMAMIEALAGQITTDPASRAWLVSSWLIPRRPIDLGVLDELTRAADGRLFREPRFRDWLRAEWTAWARQRYRRVVRSIANRAIPVASRSAPPHPRTR